MTSVLIENFTGVAPRVPALMLPDNGAQTATNVSFLRPTLAPLRLAEWVAGIGSAVESMFYYPWVNSPTSPWLTWEEEAYSIYVPITGPTDVSRYLVTAREGYPTLRKGNSVYRLGIPAPTSAPTVVATVTPDLNDPNDMALSEDIFYVYTYVDGFGYEGPPSPPSVVTTRIRDTEVTVTMAATLPSNVYLAGTGANAAFKRLYRSNTGSGATAFQFVADIPVATTTGWPDNVDNDQLQEVLPSAGWIGPPDDNTTLYPEGPMRQIVNLAGGVMAGFSGSTICLSEPYLPHAWPAEYRSSIPVQIVAISPLAEGIAVLTNGRSYVVVGSHPSAMSLITIHGEIQPCASRASVVDMGGVTFYASNEGLCSIGMTGTQVVTKDLMTAAQWQELDPSTIRGFLHKGRYVGCYGADNSDTGFIFDPHGGTAALTFTTFGFTCHWRDEQDSLVYFKRLAPITNNSGRWIWEEGIDGANAPEYMSYTWRSKPFNKGTRIGYTVCKLYKGEGACTVNIYGDGELIVTKNCASIDMFRLPSGYRCLEWEIEITGKAEVTYVMLADSIAEIR